MMIYIYIIGIAVMCSLGSQLMWVAFANPVKADIDPLDVLKYDIPAYDMPSVLYLIRMIHERLTRNTGSEESSDAGGIEPYSALDVYNEDPDMSQCAGMKLPILVGKDESGKLHYADLVKMPHVLIAGMTGFGKSMCFQNFIYWLGKSKEGIELLALDPKKTDFSRFRLCDSPKITVVTDKKYFTKTIDSLVEEMNERNELMCKLGFKDIGEFNDEMQDHKLRYKVLMIDEFQDLGLKMQEGLEEIARKGRSAGIHLILGTQNPNGNDIRPTLLGQLAFIIAFLLATKAAAERILNDNRAAKLAAKGACIVKSALTKFVGRTPLAELEDFDFYSKFEAAQKAAIAQFLKEEKEKTDTPKRGRPKKINI